MGRSVRSLYRDQRGAVAATVALSLVGLIAVGGVAFDYAHLAALHTELQQAADEAALAAASQLDGQTGACARAAAAAHDLVVNSAKFGSGSGSLVVNVPNEAGCDGTGSVQFYKAYNQTADTVTTNAAADADAKFVTVIVDSKYANYALTPITGLFQSGPITARATATLGAAAICKVPPLMMCNPNEAGGGTFPTTSDIGKGMKLEAGGGSTWAPGNYGYLNFTNSVEQGMGANVATESCLDLSTITTKPGNVAGAPAGINTRFDIYDNGLVAYCAQGSGNCSPALNTLKDVVHPLFTGAGTAPDEVAATGAGKKADNCALANGTDPWQLPTVGYIPGGATPTSMGLPRDICHAKSADGDCGGTASRFGDGNWDRALYFKVNHATSASPTGSADLSAAATWAGKSLTATSGTTALTRYDVYRWELATAGKLPRRLAEAASSGKGKTPDLYSYPTPRCEPGRAATSTIKDRRLLTAALVNCTAGGVKGSSSISPVGWVDLFVTEPSVDRGTLTGKDQIYVEVVGVATKPDGSNAFQYFRRQRPRLVK